MTKKPGPAERRIQAMIDAAICKIKKKNCITIPELAAACGSIAEDLMKKRLFNDGHFRRYLKKVIKEAFVVKGDRKGREGEFIWFNKHAMNKDNKPKMRHKDFDNDFSITCKAKSRAPSYVLAWCPPGSKPVEERVKQALTEMMAKVDFGEKLLDGSGINGDVKRLYEERFLQISSTEKDLVDNTKITDTLKDILKGLENERDEDDV